MNGLGCGKWRVALNAYSPRPCYLKHFPLLLLGVSLFALYLKSLLFLFFFFLVLPRVYVEVIDNA